MSQTRSFTGNSLEDIVDERVHDAHSLAGDTSIGVDLLQNFVDVNSIAFFTFASSLLATQGRSEGGSRGGPDPPNIMFVGKTWTSVGIFNVWI